MHSVSESIFQSLPFGLSPLHTGCLSPKLYGGLGGHGGHGEHSGHSGHDGHGRHGGYGGHDGQGANGGHSGDGGHSGGHFIWICDNFHSGFSLDP